MNTEWVKSGLVVGEKLKVPNFLFVDIKASDRLEGVYYTGETDAGIMLDCYFTPTGVTQEPEGKHYRRFINWASIWCGHVKMYREDGTLIRARRVKKQVAKGGDLVVEMQNL